MADNFSIDDILAEIDSKRAEKSNKKAPPTPSEKPSADYSVTSIIGSDELSAAVKEAERKKEKKEEKPAPQETKKIPTFGPAKKTEPAAAKAKPAVKADAAPKAEPEKKASEAAESKPKSSPAPEAKTAPEPQAGVPITAEVIAHPVPKEEAPAQKAEPEKKPADKKQEIRLINRQLEAEESFEDPDELIDAINPYEVKDKAADMDTALSGDTKGLAGNELKKMAEQPEDKKEKEESVKLYRSETKKTDESPTLEQVKEYKPHSEKEDTAEAPARKKMTEKERRSNEALLEKLNNSIKRERDEENERRKTLGLSKSEIILKPPTQGLNIDYGGRVIRPTGVLPDENELMEAEMRGKSKRKLRDFVMDEDNDEEEEEESFDSYDSNGQIWADLCESHKVIRIRLVLLVILTLFMGFVALMGDLNKGLVFDLFGNEITFLDRRADAQGFLFYNLICGVLAAALCSSVLMNGISKLFRLKADCDSVCAVLLPMTALATVLNMTRSDDIILGSAYIYIPVAIAGLMFNTLGKLIMITRAKRNFRFVSGDGTKYSAVIVEDDDASSAITKGLLGELPVLAAIRKTELLTDFLKSSYCEDKADRISSRLVPVSIAAALVATLISFVIPYGDEELRKNFFYAATVFTAILSLAAPFSTMFAVNFPLTRAGKGLSKNDSAVLGYAAAEEFSKVNSVMVDASMLFPAGNVMYSNIKHYKQPNSVNNIALDQAIILAASLAIKSGSVMSGMFRDMINDKEDILVKVENCVYEDNMGVLGWYGNKRMIMGSREQMKHHDIKVPDQQKISKYMGDNTEAIYLSVGGEIVIMFFVELMPNPEIKACLQKLTSKGVSLAVKSTDSIITVAKLAEVFEIPPEQIRILPYSLHEQFYSFTKYTSRGSGAVSCGGTFTGFAKALIAAKSLVSDINIGCLLMLCGVGLGIVCAVAAALTGNTWMLCPSMIIGWNLLWFIITAAVQSIRRY